jgi:ABC-type multidrug transport system ATPase subunit
LLNVLAGRAAGKIDGEILINGHPFEEAKQLLKYSSYIMQDDVLLANQTPKEILTFSANLKLPKGFSEVIQFLDLSHIFSNKKKIALK